MSVALLVIASVYMLLKMSTFCYRALEDSTVMLQYTCVCGMALTDHGKIQADSAGVLPSPGYSSPVEDALGCTCAKTQTTMPSQVYVVPRTKACQPCAAAKAKCEPDVGSTNCKRSASACVSM